MHIKNWPLKTTKWLADVRCITTAFYYSFFSQCIAQERYGFGNVKNISACDAAENGAPANQLLQENAKANLLKFNVYFKTMDSRLVEESVMYDTLALLYALGGALSLFLGISLAMVFEIVELIIDIVSNLARHFSSPRPKKN